MKKIIKKNGKKVHAYRLGDPNPVVEQLISEKKIIMHPNGACEIFSQESMHGKGEMAKTGDYIKVNSSGFPYPNSAEFFAANHKWISGDEYEQLPKPLYAWTAAEPMCPEIQFLIEKKGLEMHPEDPQKYFSAPLWGTIESAEQDAVVIFYSIIRDSEGHVIDADFNFVCRPEFEKDYILYED